MQPDPEQLKALYSGKHPEDLDLSGAELDGDSMPLPESGEPFDLTGANLRGTVFSRLDLRRAKLAGADLSGAVFRNVDLGHADFTWCTAVGAVLEDVNLSYTRWREADLRGMSISFANLTDTSFKGADLRGAEVNAVRFSMNGGTHVLGLKEALSDRYGPVSYPFGAGVSGDAFWMSYAVDRGELTWEGSAREILSQGLRHCGFEWKFTSGMDAEDAWKLLVRDLGAGQGVITPLHVGGAALSGTAFGGSEWIYVRDHDADLDAVRVNCLLGDRIIFPREEFLANWCVSAAPDESRVYNYCSIGDRLEDVSRSEAVTRGIRFGLELLDRGEVPGRVCGIPAYDLLLRDLDTESVDGGEGCAWTGLGLRLHHGSRWAIRDFLREACRDLEEDAEALHAVVLIYEDVMEDLRSVFRLLPESLSRDGEAGEADRSQFMSNRDEARGRLRKARGGEVRARDALREIV